jgi:hypothetical protein
MTASQWFIIGDLCLQIEADLPILDKTFVSTIQEFKVFQPTGDVIFLHHHFSLPELSGEELGTEVYHTSPWAIYWNGDRWIYLGIAPDLGDKTIHQVAFFNHRHTKGEIYSPFETFFLKGELDSLTLFPTDQILLARLLADRQGCYLHAAGLVIEGQGLGFVGHSEAGKTTISRQLMPHGELLCDDRIILRRWPAGFKIYGTWSHGDIAQVSPASAPLRALLLLEQAPENALHRLTRQEVIRTLPQFIVRPLLTKDWWEKTLDLVGHISREVPVYRLRFDRSGKVSDVLRSLL